MAVPHAEVEKGNREITRWVVVGSFPGAIMNGMFIGQVKGHLGMFGALQMFFALVDATDRGFAIVCFELVETVEILCARKHSFQDFAFDVKKLFSRENPSGSRFRTFVTADGAVFNLFDETVDWPKNEVLAKPVQLNQIVQEAGLDRRIKESFHSSKSEVVPTALPRDLIQKPSLRAVNFTDVALRSSRFSNSAKLFEKQHLLSSDPSGDLNVPHTLSSTTYPNQLDVDEASSDVDVAIAALTATKLDDNNACIENVVPSAINPSLRESVLDPIQHVNRGNDKLFFPEVGLPVRPNSAFILDRLSGVYRAYSNDAPGTSNDFLSNSAKPMFHNSTFLSPNSVNFDRGANQMPPSRRSSFSNVGSVNRQGVPFNQAPIIISSPPLYQVAESHPTSQGYGPVSFGNSGYSPQAPVVFLYPNSAHSLNSSSSIVADQIGGYYVPMQWIPSNPSLQNISSCSSSYAHRYFSSNNAQQQSTLASLPASTKKSTTSNLRK